MSLIYSQKSQIILGSALTHQGSFTPLTIFLFFYCLMHTVNLIIFCEVYPQEKLFANDTRKNLLQHVFL